MAINCTFELIEKKLYHKPAKNYDEFIKFCISSFNINETDYLFMFNDEINAKIINTENYKEIVKKLIKNKNKNVIRTFKIIKKNISEDEIEKENNDITKLYEEMENKIHSLENELEVKKSEILELKSENYKINNSNINDTFDIQQYKNNLNEINKFE